MEIDPPNVVHSFLEELGTNNFSRRSFEHIERTMHSHGSCYQEIYKVQGGKFDRSCDLVLLPGTTEHVENIVRLANKHNVVIVPYGGGTNVTQALMLPTEEKRMIVSLDMTRMNQIKWVDKENNMACV